jgi:hypothetical protein
MDGTWTTSLDQLWRSPTFPMWLTLAAAAAFALVLVVTLFRADRSVANGALTVITLLAVAVAAAATMRGGEGNVTPRAPMQVNASMPALSCIDDLAGDSVETACEKALFASPDSVAAAVSYAASQIGGLTSFGDVAAANKVMTPELRALRRAVERDRYGLVAHVLASRDRCTSTNCPAFQSLTDHQQISSNIDEKTYDGLVTRHAAAWGAVVNAAGPAAAAAAMVEAPPSVPTGKPTTADFPSSSSIPPVSIMTPEPAASTASTSTSPAAPTPAPRPAAAAKAQAKHHPAPAKRAPPAPRPAAPAPVQLAPAAPADAAR